MISTRNIITSLDEIPVEWVFETYIPGLEKLTGQEITMLSPLSTGEKRGSFTLFYEKNKRYFFKCFSSGKGGDHFEFVQLKLGLSSKSQAIQKVMNDYTAYLKTHKPVSIEDRHFKVQQKFRVTDFKLRNWNTNDKKYWTSYKIYSKTLEFLNIAPLDHFVMSKEVEGELKVITITRALLYGYFNKRGELCRIYQPNVKEAKCIKVRSFIQGEEQLAYKADNLLITKSMKDIAAFMELKIPNWEVIATESEGELLSVEYIEKKKKQYKHIAILFDNDDAGRKARAAYVKTYKIPYVDFDMGYKDLSDTMEKIDVVKVKHQLEKSFGLLINVNGVLH